MEIPLVDEAEAKYTYLLEDGNVRHWFDNPAANSYLTATVYLGNLGFYCEINGTNPKGLLRVAKTKAFRDGFTNFVRRLGSEGKAGSYIAKFKKTLHSWFSYNGLDARLKVNVRGEHETSTIAMRSFQAKKSLTESLGWQLQGQGFQ